MKNMLKKFRLQIAKEKINHAMAMCFDNRTSVSQCLGVSRTDITHMLKAIREYEEKN
jgi:hypothetical protein